MVLREYCRLLHLPTTSCILAFAIIGSMLAPKIYLDRLLCIIIQLLLGSTAANYFDELQGRPWHTKISNKQLRIIGLLTLSISILIGTFIALTIAPNFFLFITIWVFFVVAYDLELFEGRFHNTLSLGISWGSICLGSYYLQSLMINPQILVLSIITGCIAGYGRDLYEVAKPTCRDKNPSSSEVSQYAWSLLKLQISIIDIIAIVTFAYRFILVA